MIAAQVINFAARKAIASSFKEQKESEFARFITRVGHHGPAIVREGNRAAAIDNLEIDRDPGTNFELISNPKTISLRVGPALRNRVVDPGFQTRAFDRRELCLCLADTAEGQRERD